MTEAVLDATKQTEVPLSRIQGLIARRMLASKHNKPCFYLEAKADVTDLMGMRHKLSKALGVKITSNAFFIHALALAVRQYPLMVGRFVERATGETHDAAIEIGAGINVGFAVNTARGLIVPVVKNAERKSLAEIAAEEKRLTAGARSNKLTLADLEGETIALSNLGAYDIDTFLGIVPPPASAILSVGKVAPAVVARDGRPEVRKLVSMSLAADHRIVHSDYAARFLQLVIEELKRPEQLIE
jgi:pyruvate dehydrogenase E2 component (dihydrolipoamide acetyltransferase)